jgi:PAS domain S-box-containing protein
MSRRPRSPRPAPHDYTPDIDHLHHQLTALMLRWQGVAPTPPSLTEAVEELTTTVEELHAMNEDLIQSQQAALESQRRYQELFEGVPEAYLVTDLQGLIQEANRPAAHLLHIDRAHLTGLPLAVFVAQELRSAFRAQLAWLQNGAEVREWVIRVQPRHQPPVPVICHVAPALDTEGALIGLRWLLRDLKTQSQVQETIEPRGLDRTAELAHANAVLQAKLDRAELHMRELHHRMKNNLQVVSSLLDVRLKDLQDSRVSTMVQECQGRIRAMALVHEDLYRAGDADRLALGPYLQRLALQLFEAYGIDRERIPLMLQADVVEVGINTAIPCGLLVYEVLANCLQHAFPAQQGGTVMVTLQAEPAGRVTLTIRDTGRGLPEDWGVRDAGGFGLYLVRALTEQLQGTLIVTRDRGTCVTLRFPAAITVVPT